MELLKKLYELSKRGEGGEKQNAQAMLDKLLKKHNMTIEDLEGEKVSSHSMRVVKADQALFMQVHAFVFGKNASIWKAAAPSYLIFEATNSEYLLFDATYSFYKRQLKVEQKRLYSAFIMKHKIYPSDGNVLEAKDLTADQIREYLKASEMSSSLEDVHLKKLIN